MTCASAHAGHNQMACMQVPGLQQLEGGNAHALEQGGQAVVEADEEARWARDVVAEQQVGGEHADEDEELLAAQPHDGQRDLHQRDELAVLRAAHAPQLRPVLAQLPARAHPWTPHPSATSTATLHAGILLFGAPHPRLVMISHILQDACSHIMTSPLMNFGSMHCAKNPMGSHVCSTPMSRQPFSR